MFWNVLYFIILAWPLLWGLLFRWCPNLTYQYCERFGYYYTDCYLKLHEHTNLTVTKANCILGLIRRIFYCRETDMMTKLFTSLILEYGNSIWVPHYVEDLFQPALTTSTRGHNFKYCKPRCKTCYWCNFFHIGLLTTETIYPHILSMLIQSTPLKIF